MKQVLAVGLVMGLLVGCGQGAAPELAAARDGDVRLEVTLLAGAAYPAADGEAEYRDRGGERELEVEVEDVRSLRGQTLSVLVGGNRVGGARVNNFGDARLELNSDAGQRVPVVRSGTRVQVETPAGTLVVSGSFEEDK